MLVPAILARLCCCLHGPVQPLPPPQTGRAPDGVPGCPHLLDRPPLEHICVAGVVPHTACSSHATP
eukprot:5563984-Pyramimonas_sp.AAC.1